MWRRTILTAVACSCLLSAGVPVFAQPGVTDGASSPTNKLVDPLKRTIREAYRLSKVAKSEEDFVKMVEMLDGVLKNRVLAGESRDYAKRLKGWAHNRRGEILAAEGKEKVAFIQFEQAVALNGDHWKARYNRGVSFSFQGEIEKAVDELTRAIELKRDHSMSWFNRGEAYYAQGKLRESIRDYTEAIRLDPENARFYHHRGHSHYRLREYEPAIGDFDSSIELKSNDPVPYVYRGDAYAELGGYEQALRDYRRSLGYDKELGRTYLSIAWLLATCPDEDFRKVDQALAAAQKAIALDGEQAGHRYLEALAAAHANAGEFEEAQEVQTQAIEQAPESLREDCRTRLDLYGKQQPYRQRPALVAGQWRSKQNP